MKRALIIEDDEVFIQYYKNYLAKYDIVVDVAGSLKDAFEYMEENDYDIFLIDIVLESEDVDEVGTDIIGKGAAPNLCIILSAYLHTKKDIIDLSKKHGIPIDRILPKPLDSRILEKAIGKILGKKSIFGLDIWELAKGTSIDLFHWLKNMTFRKAATIFVIFVFLWAFVPTYVVWRSHNYHREFQERRNNYAESLFQNYSEFTEITNSTYIQDIVRVNKDLEVIVRLYPNDFIYIKIIHSKYPPEEMWIAHGEFLKSQGLDPHSNTFFELFLRSWFRTKQLFNPPRF